MYFLFFFFSVLTLCGTKFSIVATECRGFAIDYMLKLDVKSVDGVLIAGGDGLVHEVGKQKKKQKNNKPKKRGSGVWGSELNK
jgi:diacylglycerol kinase family enzyme